MPVVATLSGVAKPWADLFGQSAPLAIGLLFLHLGAMLVAGGLAVSADRQVLRLRRWPERRAFVLDELAGVHRPVIAGLVVVIGSGSAMALADVETFLPSPIFWVKMGLLMALLLNGLRLQRAEARVQLDTIDDRAWSRLNSSAAISLALWLLLTLCGVLLMNA